MTEPSMYEVIVNSLAAHVAVLDENGVIVETNYAWQKFARDNDMALPVCCTGINYLDICDTSAEQCGEETRLIGQAIRKVISGDIQEFLTQYPCHSPTQKRWFSLRVMPYRSEEFRRVIVTHEDITPIIIAQETLRKKDEELQDKTVRLEETNVALKVLLDHRDRDRQNLEDRIVANIRELVLPYVEKLQNAGLKQREKTLTEIISHHLQDIITPFLNRLSSLNLLLTPHELEVATLVRQGKSSQEIADVLNVSVAAISFHRKKLRRKLGLSNKKVNLRTYLLSLQ